MANRVEPAHFPGCFKMFYTTEANRDEPGMMSRAGVNRGDALAIPAQSVAPPCLYLDMPAAMKTVSNGGAPFCTGGDTVLHDTSRLSLG